MPLTDALIDSYLLTYSSLLLVATLVYCADYLFYLVSSLKASRTIHRQLVKSVLGTTLRCVYSCNLVFSYWFLPWSWLDETPTSRIVARCTQDIRSIDDQIPQSLFFLSELGISMVTKLGAVVLFTPMFFFPGMLVGALGMYAGNIYMRAQLSVKREMRYVRISRQVSLQYYAYFTLFA